MSEIQEISYHLNELRKSIVRIAITVGIISMFLISFHAEPIQVNGIQLFYPTPDPLDNIAAQDRPYGLRLQHSPNLQTHPIDTYSAQHG